MGGGGIAALLLGLWWLDACGGCDVSPGGDLDHVVWHAVQIADVVLAAGAKLSPDGHTEQVGQERCSLSFGTVALALLGASHGWLWRLDRRCSGP